MMGTEIFKIDASWAEKLTKTRVSFLTAPTVLQCTVKPDPQNLASALLEGAWEVDESWSLQLAGELEPEAEATQTLSFYRNDSIADILPAEVCQYYPQRIYMAGELSWERKDGSSNGKNTAFLISTSPDIYYCCLC